MIILRNPSSHPLFQASFASPPFSHHWVVANKQEQANKTATEAEKNDNDTVSQASKKATNAKSTSSPVDPRLTLNLGEFELHRPNEKAEHFLLTTELPGVKHADLKVEFRDGALHIQAERRGRNGSQRFARRLAMDEDAIDVAGLAATLEDGILTVKVPEAKKEDKSEEAETSSIHKVTVETKSPPCVEQKDVELNLEVDVPGVKPDDLQVVWDKESGMIHIVGERRNSTGPSKLSKASYRLNTRTVDMTKLEGFLKDGVLTLRAPPKLHPIKIVAVNGHFPAVAETIEPKEAPKDTKPEDEVKEDTLPVAKDE